MNIKAKELLQPFSDAAMNAARCDSGLLKYAIAGIMMYIVLAGTAISYLADLNSQADEEANRERLASLPEKDANETVGVTASDVACKNTASGTYGEFKDPRNGQSYKVVCP